MNRDPERATGAAGVATGIATGDGPSDATPDREAANRDDSRSRGDELENGVGLRRVLRAMEELRDGNFRRRLVVVASVPG